MSLYKNAYRIESARLRTWDYRWNAAYFITICTHDKTHSFGEIIRNGIPSNEFELAPTETGKLAYQCWAETPQHFPNVLLDVFTIMPNHMHGILILNNPLPPEIAPPLPRTGEQNNGSLKNEIMSARSPKKGSLSTIIRSYKSAVAKLAHSIDPGFTWQSRFHDHIIRTEEEFQKIRHYIINNPRNWEKDKFHSP